MAWHLVYFIIPLIKKKQAGDTTRVMIGGIKIKK